MELQVVNMKENYFLALSSSSKVNGSSSQTEKWEEREREESKSCVCF